MCIMYIHVTYLHNVYMLLTCVHTFQIAMCDRPMREVSNPGASGSLFYLSADDAFIIKTVQKKEAQFLQKLLPGYYLVGVAREWRGGTPWWVWWGSGNL